jgi:hypothetical protein
MKSTIRIIALIGAIMVVAARRPRMPPAQRWDPYTCCHGLPSNATT